MGTLTLIDGDDTDELVHEIEAHVENGRVHLAPSVLATTLGWKLETAGLCRGDVCVPVRDRDRLVDAHGVDLAELARLLDRPLALDVDERVAALGTSAGRRADALRSLTAPDFALRDLEGRTRRLSDDQGKKRLLVTWGSWCGCREDLPVWQALHEELGPKGFTPITIALDTGPEAARPFIERAAPTHPSLIDPEHRVAELFNMINVPTMVWIDEEGRIVRPNDQQFGNDMFVQLTGRPPAPFLAALRAWVNEGRGALAADEVREQQLLPSGEQQLARVEFRLGWHLHRAGRTEAAARHFLRAGELAPGDWTIRRATLPIRGIDPMTSAEFLALWEQGIPQYPTRNFTPEE
jgi:peroxiredoxin